MHHRCLLLDDGLSGCGARCEEGNEDHLDLESRLEYEAWNVAREDRLRYVRKGSDERYGEVSLSSRTVAFVTVVALALLLASAASSASLVEDEHPLVATALSGLDVDDEEDDER